MPENLARKLIASHLESGELTPGADIAIRVDQVLTHDATGPLIALELEAMGVDAVRPELAVGYVDHMMVQDDHRNADDHLFLHSACRRFGRWYSRPGNGISHPVHQERFGKPGATLLGADSHTPAQGAIAMLAIGAGGVAVALALAGEAFSFRMPDVWGVRLVGELPDWVSAKDVVLEMLRRHSVEAATGRIIEYHGPGLACLSAWTATRSPTWAPSSARPPPSSRRTLRCGVSCAASGERRTSPRSRPTRAPPTTRRTRSTFPTSSRSSRCRPAPTTSSPCRRWRGRRSTKPTSARPRTPAIATSRSRR